MLWLVLIALALFLLVERWKIQPFIELSKEIKCDIKSYPLIGHAHLFAGGGTTRMKTLQRFGREAIKNGGTTTMWLGRKCCVVIVDAVDLEMVMKMFLEKDNLVRFSRKLIGNGLIFAPVSIWRPRRKISAPTFSLNNLNNFVEVFARQSSIMVNQLKSVAGNEVMSVWKYITTFTLVSICETALGVKLNAQENLDQELLKAFDTVCKLDARRMLQPWLYPDMVYKLLPYHSIYEKNKKILHDFVNEINKEALKINKEMDKGGTEKVKCFLELLIEASGGERGYSDQELLEETLVMLLAGTDTSAVGTSFTISMLAKHPDVQAKVFQELQEVFGNSDRPVVPGDLPRLKYLDAVIRETLRVYPPVPAIVREVPEDTKLPSGVTVRKGGGIIMLISGVHRNPVYWGDDAEQFRPERFIEAPLKHPAAFMPFSHGPRSCLGYQYAMMSMKTALATFLRTFRVLSEDENRNQEPLKLTFDIMMKDADGFRVKLVKRGKE